MTTGHRIASLILQISRNFRQRAIAPFRIVIHQTAGTTLIGALETLALRGFSYHDIIDIDGTLHELVNLNREAFHAGRGNAGTIGLAFVGNFSNGSRPTAAQITTAKKRIRYYRENFNISDMVGHDFYVTTACPSFDINILSPAFADEESEESPKCEKCYYRANSTRFTLLVHKIQSILKEFENE